MFQGLSISHLAGGCGALGRTIGVNTAFKKGFERLRVRGGKSLRPVIAPAIATETPVADSDDQVGGRGKIRTDKNRHLKKEKDGDKRVGRPVLIEHSEPSSDINNFFRQFPNKYQFPAGEGPKVLVQVRRQKVGRGGNTSEIMAVHFRTAEPEHPLETLNGVNPPWVSFNQLHIRNFKSKFEGEKGRMQEQLHTYLRGLLLGAGLLEKPEKREKPYGGAVVRPKQETLGQFRERLVAEGKIKPNVATIVSTWDEEVPGKSSIPVVIRDGSNNSAAAVVMPPKAEKEVAKPAEFPKPVPAKNKKTREQRRFRAPQFGR